MADPAIPRRLRIATRASALAVWQSEHVAALLRQAAGVEVELVRVSTLGDRDRTGPLASMGGQGVFTREVQQAVLNGDADLAVHSLKDLPTTLTPGLQLAGVPTRAPRCDALLLPDGRPCASLDELPPGATVGAGSPRRRAQLLAIRPDLEFADIRGNLDTRLRKLDAGEYDALILAEAGLLRLDWASRISLRLAPPVMLPAVGQGAIGVECRDDDHELAAWLARVSDAETRAEVDAERACLHALRAGCHAPLGVWATLTAEPGVDWQLRLQAVVLSLDGRVSIGANAQGPVSEAVDVGRRTAEGLLQAGGECLLRPPR